MRIRLAVLLLIGLVLYAYLARSETLTLPAAADTTLFQFAPDNNLGGYVTLAAGTTGHGDRSRALLKFDVAGNIPAEARITATRLHLRVVRTPGLGGRASAFALHRMLTAWNEGDKAALPIGAPATEGEATWNNRIHPSVPWSLAGGEAGVDFAAAPSASAFISSTGAYTFATSPAAVADVQGWLERPAENRGWILMSQSEGTWETARRIAAREDAANGPVLEIDYATFWISRAERENGTIKVFFPVRPGFRYTVEARPSVASGEWSTITNFTETASSYEGVAFDSTQSASQKFYRVARDPL